MTNRTLAAYLARNDAQIASLRKRIRVESVVAALAFCLAVVVFAAEGGQTAANLAGLLLGIVGLAFALDAWRLQARQMVGVTPSEGRIYESAEWPPRRLDVGERYSEDIAAEAERIALIQPSVEEVDAGFGVVWPGLGCPEPALSSRNLNDWLVSTPEIAMSRSQSVGLPNRLSRQQRMMLWARVNANTTTTDDPKLCLISNFDTVPIERVEVAQRSYFDGIATNEAFRSRIYEKAHQSGRPGTLVADFVELKSLPVGSSGPMLPRLGQASASNHIGGSVLILTADHRAVLFEQGIRQEEGAGRIVVSGTGSADWGDLSDVPGEHGLLDVIRATMLREFFEEGTVLARDNKISRAFRDISAPAKLRLEMGRDLSVIGFFRWVSRFGKPEFLGFGRTPLLFDEIEADKAEVVDLAPTDMPQRQIRKMSDLIELKESLKRRSQVDGVSMALSSAMVIHRLAEIAAEPQSDAYDRLCKRHGLAPG